MTIGAFRTFGLLLTINAVLALGDVLAKRAVATATRSLPLTLAALAVWIVGCGLWLPAMRARGFTRLIALADVVGLLMLVGVGYVFLGERLSRRELAGVVLAIAAVLLLASTPERTGADAVVDPSDPRGGAEVVGRLLGREAE